MSAVTAIEAALYLAAGAALGTLYCVLLYRVLSLHARHAAILKVAPLHIGRLGITVAAFWAVAQYGAWPLLITLLGFVAARSFMQRRIGST
jgi:hypothetical protein